MHAINPPTPPQSPVRRASMRRLNTSSRRQASSDRLLAVEMGVKLLVNGIIATAAITSLVRLIPYTQQQQAKLQDLHTAVADAEKQTSRLRADFTRYFDPRQAQNVMQEQSGREAPSERQVVWIDSTKTP